MADGVLFAPASLPPPSDAIRNRQAIEANIAMCEFFVQILDEAPPLPVFQGFIEYALECVRDPALPTRNIAVFFRDYAIAGAELRRLRESLPADGLLELKDFHEAEELERQLRGLLDAWYSPLRPKRL